LPQAGIPDHFLSSKGSHGEEFLIDEKIAVWLGVRGTHWPLTRGQSYHTPWWF